MEDYDELWNQYAIEFNNKLESDHDGDWNQLDEIEQEIAALWKLTTDMYSGGFDEFFLNWGYNCYSYAMRGIKRIANSNEGDKKEECKRVFELFNKAYTDVFVKFENDKRIQSYVDIIEYLDDEDGQILEDTYNIFDEELGPILCERAYEFYCKKLKRVL